MSSVLGDRCLRDVDRTWWEDFLSNSERVHRVLRHGAWPIEQALNANKPRVFLYKVIYSREALSITIDNPLCEVGVTKS